MPVARYYTPDEFVELREVGLGMGFSHVQASPLTRSSYHAWEQARSARPERSEGSPANGGGHPGRREGSLKSVAERR